MPVQLLADAANGRDPRQCFEVTCDRLAGEIRERHLRRRPAGSLVLAVHPQRFVEPARRRPVRLHVDAAGHAVRSRVGEVFLARIVAPDRLIGTEDPRKHRTGEPREVCLSPDVVVPVDDHDTTGDLTSKGATGRRSPFDAAPIRPVKARGRARASGRTTRSRAIRRPRPRTGLRRNARKAAGASGSCFRAQGGLQRRRPRQCSKRIQPDSDVPQPESSKESGI